MWAAKSKSEDGVISLIERGSDPNPKFPDGRWLLDSFPTPEFPARVTAARQIWSAKSSAKSSNLLLSILNASPSPNGVSPNSTNGSAGGMFSSPPGSALNSPNTPSSLDSPSNGSIPPLGKLTKVGGTIRRSTISMKATADKDIVMSFELSKDTKAALATPAPLLGHVPHSRRGSVAYATLRPRSTLSSAEGVALREEVAAQLSGGFSSSSPTVLTSKSVQSPVSNESLTPTPIASSSNAIFDPSAGSVISEAFSSPDLTKDKKSSSKKDKDGKKDKKEKEKKSKKDTKSATDSPSISKKDQKKEFRRKQEENEALKAEARAEKTKKRKTISFFGKSDKSSNKDESVPVKSPKSSKFTKTSTTASTSSSTFTASSSSPPTTDTTNNASSAPITTDNPTTSTSSTPKTSASTVVAAPTQVRQASEVPGPGEQFTVVDNIPEGAVALPNGDFLIGVEADAVNLDALTDAMAKVVREAVSPLLGTPNFEIKALLEATKVLSTTLKSILSVSDVYALTLDSPEAGREFTKITESLRTEIAKSLVLAIKSVTVNSNDVEPLKRAMADLSEHVSRLYKCLESASPASVVENLQGVVVTLRSVVSASKSESKETYQQASSQAVIVTMRLCSLVQDFAFASCKSLRNQRSLVDSAFALAQSVRGLIIAANGVLADPKSEQHANGMAQMLKTAAEYVRSVSRTLREEEMYTANPKLAQENDSMLEPAPQEVVLAYLRKGCGLMANAKDKYVAKSTVGLANDEKQVLSLIVSQAQLVATLMDALAASDMTRVTQIAVSTGSSMSSLQRLLQPILDTCLDQDLVEETVVCLENVIRCGIQVKILASLIASHSNSSEYRLQLAQTCQLWGVYNTLLLEAVWRAAHVM
jgi:hypothetical protein